jgi:hypothetical protein
VVVVVVVLLLLLLFQMPCTGALLADHCQHTASTAAVASSSMRILNQRFCQSPQQQLLADTDAYDAP